VDDLSSWSCEGCTYLNTPSGLSGSRVLGASRCEMCGQARRKRYVLPS
jgi:hypothetical protein